MQSLSIAAAVALQLIVSIGIQLVVVRLAGISPSTDAFMAAAAVPSVVGAVIAAALQNVWLARLALAEGFARERDELSLACGQAVALAFLAQGLLWISGALWIPVLFHGFSGTEIEHIRQLSLPFCLANALGSQSLMLLLALRVNQRFLLAETIAALAGLIVLAATFWVVPAFGVDGAAWLGVLRGLLVYLSYAHLNSWPRPSLLSGIRDVSAWKLMRPIVLSSSISKTAPLLDRFLTSYAPAGTLTLYSLAYTGATSLMTVLDRSYALPQTSNIVRAAGAGKVEEVRASTRHVAARLAFFAAALAGGLWLLIEPIEALLSQLLRLGGHQSHILWATSISLLPCAAAGAAATPVVAAFAAMGNTITPSRIAIVGFALSIPIKILAFYAAGTVGLAIAVSIYYAMNLIALRSRLLRSMNGRLS